MNKTKKLLDDIGAAKHLLGHLYSLEQQYKANFNYNIDITCELKIHVFHLCPTNCDFLNFRNSYRSFACLKKNI